MLLTIFRAFFYSAEKKVSEQIFLRKLGCWGKWKYWNLKQVSVSLSFPRKSWYFFHKSSWTYCSTSQVFKTVKISSHGILKNWIFLNASLLIFCERRFKLECLISNRPCHLCYFHIHRLKQKKKTKTRSSSSSAFDHEKFIKNIHLWIKSVWANGKQIWRDLFIFNFYVHRVGQTRKQRERKNDLFAFNSSLRINF